MAAADREAYWSNELQAALGPLHPEQLAAAVRASIETERSGAVAEDCLWAGKEAASNWEDDRTPVAPIPEYDDFQTVAIVDPSVAGVYRASLETAGIPAVLKQGTGWILGLTIGPEGEVSVLVPPGQVAEARDLLTRSSPTDFPEGD